MNDPLIGALVSNTAVAALLGVAGWCVAHLAGRPATAHLLFVLALVKLVTPPLWRIDLGSVSPADATHGSALVAQPAVAVALPAEVPKTGAPPRPTTRSASPATDPGPAATSTATAPRPASPGGWPVRDLAFGIWVLGGLAVASLTLHRGRRPRRALACALTADAAVAREVDVARRRVGLARAPRIVVVDAVDAIALDRREDRARARRA